MTQMRMLDETVRHAIEETWAVLAGHDTANPALFLVRLADLARSNAFLCAETGLQVQELSIRTIQIGQGLSRSLVLATVAADILVSYTSLRERAKWLPSLVKSRDWQLQHPRLGTASSRRVCAHRARADRSGLDCSGTSRTLARQAIGRCQGAVPGYREAGGNGSGGV